MSTSRASSPTAGDLGQVKRLRAAGAAGARAASAGRARSSARGSSTPASCRRPSGVDEERAVVAVGRREQSLERRRRQPRHVDGEHRHRRRPSASSASSPASRPAAGPPCGGSSRTNVTGRLGRHLLADDDHLGRVGHGAAARARAGSGRRTRSPALSTPPIRAAVPPARTTAAYGGRGLMPRSLPRRGPAGVAGWGPCARSRRPAGLRARPGDNRSLLARAHPRRRRPGGLPRGVRPRLRRGRAPT